MQRTMTNEELSTYLLDLPNQSDAFKVFLNHYVTGDSWIRSRGEEDVTVWHKLKGKELEIAKAIILDELRTIPDIAYIRAVGYFRDDRGLPILKNIAETLPERFCGEKLLAAKVLYDWTGYDKFILLFESACKSKNKITHDYLEISFNSLTDSLRKPEKDRLFDLLMSAE